MTTFFHTYVLELVLLVELGLLSFSIIFNMMITLYFGNKERKTKKAREFLNKKIIELIEEKIAFSSKLFSKRYLSLPIFVPVLEAFNQRVSGEVWENMKEGLINGPLKKKVIHYLLHYNLVKRSWGIRAIKLVVNQQYEPYILKLLKDPVPIIRFAAVVCCVKNKSEKLINATIDGMSRELRFARYPYRDELIKGDNTVYSTILERYKIESDPQVKIACLEILSTKMGYITLDLVRKDLDADHYELRWWAIRSLEKYPTEKTVDYLIQACDDESWQIQALATRSLGLIHAKKGIPILEKKLSAIRSWVRLNAALALKDFEEEGEAILRRQKKEISPEAFQVATYVLTLPRLDPKKWITTDPKNWLAQPLGDIKPKS